MWWCKTLWKEIGWNTENIFSVTSIVISWEDMIFVDYGLLHLDHMATAQPFFTKDANIAHQKIRCDHERSRWNCRRLWILGSSKRTSKSTPTWTPWGCFLCQTTNLQCREKSKSKCSTRSRRRKTSAWGTQGLRLLTFLAYPRGSTSTSTRNAYANWLRMSSRLITTGSRRSPLNPESTLSCVSSTDALRSFRYRASGIGKP